MNYYMDIVSFAGNLSGNACKPNIVTNDGTGARAKEYADLARRLYQEIGMVEEDHVSMYGSLIDPGLTPLQCNLMHEYTEAYLYYSNMETESDPHIKKIWQMHFEEEISHLAQANQLLQQYEHTDYHSVVGDGVFPEPLSLHSNVDYVRKVLRGTVTNTGMREDYAKVETLPQSFDFFTYQRAVNKSTGKVASHQVIVEHQSRFGTDYRYETSPNPIRVLRDRKTDNASLGIAAAVKAE